MMRLKHSLGDSSAVQDYPPKISIFERCQAELWMILDSNVFLVSRAEKLKELFPFILPYLLE
jgi:hypothetical protein